METTAVTVITGFLGAGKTTLVDRWLRQCVPGEVAVIVNELGAVGIDGELLRARVKTLLEIAGGCLCCTTHEELVRALVSLATGGARRIVVETSGAASPAGVLRAIHRIDDVRLDGIVTVVDAAAARGPSAHEADLAAEQLGYADVVVLAQADRVDERTLADARAAVTRANPAAVVAPSSRGVLHGYDGVDALLAARANDDLMRLVPQASAHRAIEALVLKVDGALDEERFAAWMEDELGRFAGRLLRVKGIVAIEGVAERAILQGVADRMEVSLGAAWEGDARSSRLVVIGFGLERDELSRGFALCAAGPWGASASGRSL